MPDSTAQSANTVLSPIVEMDSRSRLYSDLRRKLFPSEIRGILEGALMGNLWQQEQLWSQMADSWYRLQKNLRELTQAVSRVNYIVSPYKANGAKEPTPRAIEKANTVKRAIWGMDPVETRADARRALAWVKKRTRGGSTAKYPIFRSEISELADGRFQIDAFKTDNPKWGKGEERVC